MKVFDARDNWRHSWEFLVRQHQRRVAGEAYSRLPALRELPPNGVLPSGATLIPVPSGLSSYAPSLYLDPDNSAWPEAVARKAAAAAALDFDSASDEEIIKALEIKTAYPPCFNCGTGHRFLAEVSNDEHGISLCEACLDSAVLDIRRAKWKARKV